MNGKTQETNIIYPIPSMWLAYLPTWMMDFYGLHAGKYAIPPMDAASQFQISVS